MQGPRRKHKNNRNPDTRQHASTYTSPITQTHKVHNAQNAQRTKRKTYKHAQERRTKRLTALDPHLRRVRMSRRGHLPDGCPFGNVPQLRQDLLERPADLTVGGGLGGTTTVLALALGLALAPLASPLPHVRWQEGLGWLGLAAARDVVEHRRLHLALLGLQHRA